MKQFHLILAVALGVLLGQSVQAVTYLSSQFVGYSSGNLGADATTGTLDGWQNSTASVTLTNGSGSLIGTNLGLVASSGDRVFLSGITNTAFNTRNQYFTNGTFAQTNPTSIYYSWLYKFNTVTNVDPNGEVLIRVNRANSGTGTPQHWDLLAKSVAGQIQVGISKAGAPNNATNYASTNLSAGQIFFVVVRQQIITGVSNDVYDLWINPPPGSFGTNELDVPPVSTTIGALPTDGAEDQSTTGPGRFVVTGGADAEFDELRIASTWAEATPPFGQCLGAGVSFVTPTNVIQSAEIGATFRIAALGTSPTVQWQLSTNSGSTWNNIPGAISTTYNTPNLGLADSVDRFRAIVSVGCNSSSATSVMASVTLTNPVPTANGIIMNDTFTDPDLGFDDRANPPLTSTNSLWYTATTDNLTAFGQGGNMLGIPISGGSSLWLGYFTDTNKVPVHLAVGQTIRVTLPFTPNAFGSFTNNAGLRMGLYDYYDGGTRITADGPTVGGSQGQGTSVRGYMMNLDFGPTFSVNSPVGLLARNFLADNNLMGTTSDYDSLGSGPAGGGYSNSPAFLAGTQYTLEFLVSRADVNTVVLTANVTGGGTNWSHTVVDYNYAYHRFDSFGIRPNSLETSADSFTFPQFTVEVLTGVNITLPTFDFTEIRTTAPGSLKLTWDSVNGATYYVLSSPTLDFPSSSWATNATILATGPSTSYTNSPTTGTARFFRVMVTPFTL